MIKIHQYEHALVVMNQQELYQIEVYTMTVRFTLGNTSTSTLAEMENLIHEGALYANVDVIGTFEELLRQAAYHGYLYTFYGRRYGETATFHDPWITREACNFSWPFLRASQRYIYYVSAYDLPGRRCPPNVLDVARCFWSMDWRAIDDGSPEALPMHVGAYMNVADFAREVDNDESSIPF